MARNVLDNLIEKLNVQLMTGRDFNELLCNFLRDKFQSKVYLQYIITDEDQEQYTYGAAGEGVASLSLADSLADGYSVRTIIWQENNELSIEECNKLIRAYWNTDSCDAVCGLPATDRSEFIQKCNQTMKEWQKDRSIAFVMLDLDNFKLVNDKYNHTIGTNVISEFSRIVFKALDGRGILIHQSGDEFNLLLTYEDYTQILDILFQIFKEVSAHTFKDAEDIELTMAMGVWLVGKTERVNFMDFRVKAEESYNPKSKNSVKQRNSIRIDKGNINPEAAGKDMVLGLVRVIGNCHNKYLFHNIFLDFIAALASKINQLDEIQNELKRFLDWVNPEYNEEMRVAIACDAWDTDFRLSISDIGLAVLQGILNNKNIFGRKILFHVHENKLRLSVGDVLIAEFDCIGKNRDIKWETTEISAIPEAVDVRKMVLVQAGYNDEHEVPEDVFCRRICVDARPTVGGGLPDFWAAILAALITVMSTNPNLDDIAIYGDVENIQYVRKYLDSVSDWSEEEIKYFSKKTYKSYDEILQFKNVFSGHIHIFKKMEELLHHYLDIYQYFKFKTNSSAKGENKNKRFMERKLSYSEVQLSTQDGCKADTIAQAYPIVLEILRNCPFTGMIDQAGRELVELTDFKIELNTPRIDVLPEYYHYDESEVEQYYKNVFLDSKGLFRERLDENNQLEKMIEHVISVIKGERIYATRRAILVVSNEPGNAYSPLGLVSIWLAPRYLDGEVSIDYSYTWRTVEAIVGLPLSMYASVKFAEYITGEIIKGLGEYTCKVRMGKVSYMAYSLHMFADEESLEIVRGIINEISL